MKTAKKFLKRRRKRKSCMRKMSLLMKLRAMERTSIRISNSQIDKNGLKIALLISECKRKWVLTKTS